MCLVLGTPGSGCSTFLKTIANERQDFHYVGGDIRYAGIDAEEMAKTYKGELVYNAEGVYRRDTWDCPNTIPRSKMTSIFPPLLLVKLSTSHFPPSLQVQRGVYQASLAQNSMPRSRTCYSRC